MIDDNGKITVLLIFRCSRGHRSYAPNYPFNRGMALDFGTPYRCPTCREALGSKNVEKEASCV